MTDLDGLSTEEHPRPSHIPDIEYEDEPPGSYLGEFRVGWWKLAWSAINAVLVVVIAGTATDAAAAVEAPALTVIWELLPASCLLSFCLTLWLTAVGHRRSARLVVLACFALDFVSLLFRFYP